MRSRVRDRPLPSPSAENALLASPERSTSRAPHAPQTNLGPARNSALPATEARPKCWTQARRALAEYGTSLPRPTEKIHLFASSGDRVISKNSGGVTLGTRNFPLKSLVALLGNG